MLPLELSKANRLINHQQKIMSVGSCFTEHIGNALLEFKFKVLQNPNGILFDPSSVCTSLLSYLLPKQYKTDDLFLLHELWHSWQHHSRFSGMDKDVVLQQINDSQKKAHLFLKSADWLIITLGSAFSYQLKEDDLKGVANCHRAPAQTFRKYFTPINEIIADLENTIQKLQEFNPQLNIIFTISPVRHIRDGVVENNRSKARLIEAVHHVVTAFDNLFYFPAYELLIDVLRDYRFYDVDLVHPNYPATSFVLEKFQQAFMSKETMDLTEEIKKIVIARKHRSANPQTAAHQKFLKINLEKAYALQVKYPFLNMQNEINHFKSTI